MSGTFELFDQESMLLYHSFELFGRKSIQMDNQTKRFCHKTMLINHKTMLINDATTLIYDPIELIFEQFAIIERQKDSRKGNIELNDNFLAINLITRNHIYRNTYIVLNKLLTNKHFFIMSKETYSIPASPNGRFDFQRNALELFIANATAWGIPAEKLTAIAPKRTDYESKYAVTNNRSTQSPAATAAREAAWDVLQPALSELYDHHVLNNDDISANDKEALHIHYLGSGGSSSSSAPTTTPIVTLAAEEISVLHPVFADSASPGSHSKPANVAFCEINYKIDAPAPAVPAECPERANITRSHEAMVFTPDQRGKTVYGFARWVNRNGKTGPWSGLFTAIIP